VSGGGVGFLLEKVFLFLQHSPNGNLMLMSTGEKGVRIKDVELKSFE
jgi:hypothetical protein